MTEGRIVGPDTVRFDRLLPGTVEEVWDFLIRPEHLAKWMAEVTLDAGVGGKVVLRWTLYHDPGTGEEAEVSVGTIVRFEPPRLISYTWNEPSADPRARGRSTSLVTFHLSPFADGVLLTLTHSRLRSDEFSGVSAGWHALLDILAARLGDVEPPVFAQRYAQMQQIYAAAATHSANTTPNSQ